MTSIPSNSPSLATALLDLSGQTTPATSQQSSLANLTLPSTTTADGTSDTLDLSQQAAARLQQIEAEIAQQNSTSTLADSAAATAANGSAVSFVGENPNLAVSAQGSLDPASVLSLL